MRELAGVDVNDVIRQRADEINVVADENERALELVERVEQRVNAVHVEVRGRFVHEQQVRRIEQQLHEREPAFLAAAQHADLLNTSSPTNRKLPSSVRTNCSVTRDGVSSASSSTVRLMSSMSTRYCE